MIIWAASWPRSGSTLFRIAWHTYTGLPTYSYANDPLFKKKEWRPIIGQRRLPLPYAQMVQKEQAAEIYLIKAHLYAGAVNPNGTMRNLLIVRDVRDAIVSLAHYTTWRKRLDYKQELERIIEMSTWLPFNQSWSERAGAIVRYEDLKAAPLSTLQWALRELDVRVSINTGAKMPRFKRLHGLMPDFFRVGRAGGWREALTDEQEARIWARNGELMEQLGYER